MAASCLAAAAAGMVPATAICRASSGFTSCGARSVRLPPGGLRPAVRAMASAGAATAPPASPPPKLLSPALKSALLSSVKAFIFDCDGVIWKGDSVIPGVPETLDLLRSQGKRLFFVTNNSTKSRKGYLGKFTSLGLNIAPEEIFSSSYAAAAYLSSIKVSVRLWALCLGPLKGRFRPK